MTTATPKPFTVGDRVRFAEVLDPGDGECLFDVIEDNGDRVTVRDVSDMTIRGTKVVMRSDLVKVEGTEP